MERDLYKSYVELWGKVLRVSFASEDFACVTISVKNTENPKDVKESKIKVLFDGGYARLAADIITFDYIKVKGVLTVDERVTPSGTLKAHMHIHAREVQINN